MIKKKKEAYVIGRFNQVVSYNQPILIEKERKTLMYLKKKKEIYITVAPIKRPIDSPTSTPNSSATANPRNGKNPGRIFDMKYLCVFKIMSFFFFLIRGVLFWGGLEQLILHLKYINGCFWISLFLYCNDKIPI
jgi:hypothetical protein